jgi:hypothetical protein
VDVARWRHRAWRGAARGRGACLRRALGLTVRVEGLLDVGSDYRNLAGGIDFHGIFIVYVVTITAGTPRVEADGAVLAPTWVKQAELDSLPVLDPIRAVLGRQR